MRTKLQKYSSRNKSQKCIKCVYFSHFDTLIVMLKLRNTTRLFHNRAYESKAEKLMAFAAASEATAFAEFLRANISSLNGAWGRPHKLDFYHEYHIVSAFND